MIGSKTINGEEKGKKEIFRKTRLIEKIKILNQAQFDFVFAAITAFGGSLVTYLWTTTNTPDWMSGLIIFVWLLIIFALIYQRAKREEAREISKIEISEKKALQEIMDKEHKDEAINLTDRAINYFTRSLRVVTEEIRILSKIDMKTISEEEKNNAYSRFKKNSLQQLFRDIRSVFEGDTRGVDTTTWPHNFFKIALFEPIPNPKQAVIMMRTYYDYPEGIVPSLKTDEFSIREYSRSALVLAFEQQGIIIIEDIKAENEKEPEVKRWMNKRENQVRDYESMVCASIVKGAKDQPDRECLGVLVIDTNRVRYFREERSFQAFLGNVLNPFRTLLSFILEMKKCVG